MEFKERLKQAMDARGISATELSNKSGINKSQISRYLSGERSPKQDAVEQMAKVLNVSVVWLLGLEVDITFGLNKTNLERLEAYARKLKELQDLEESEQ